MLRVASDVTVVLAPPLACTVPSRGSDAAGADVEAVSEPSEPDVGVVTLAVAVSDDVESC